MTMNTWVRTFYTAMVFDSKQMFHRRSLASFVAYNILNPIFFLLSAWVAYTILQSVGPTYFRGITGITSYMTFATIGLSFNGIISQSSFIGFNAIKLEQWQGTIEPIFSTPASNYAWLMGKLVVGELYGFVPLIGTLLFGYGVFGIQVASAPAIVVAALAIAMMLVSMSVLASIFAGISIFVSDPTSPAVLVTSYLAFFSGLAFPVSILPAQAQWIAWSLPSTYGVDVTRNALLLGLGLDNAQVQVELLKMFVVTIVCLVVGYLGFVKALGAAKKRGALGTM
jgi:ABC-2 type transport system permease protein